MFAGKVVDSLDSRARQSGIRILAVEGSTVFTVVGIPRTSEGYLDCSGNGAPVGVLSKFRGMTRRGAIVGTVVSVGTDVAGTIAAVDAVAKRLGAVAAADAVAKRLGAIR